MKKQQTAPVVFLVFNRPDKARKVFDAIAEAKPPILLVIADGPRSNHPEDDARCEETRAIIEDVDWQCTVHKNYADTNMGLKKRIPSGLEWAFSIVDRAIILEDDCLPNPTFFPFCSQLLNQYLLDNRIFGISGDNLLSHKSVEFEDSYYFSYNPYIWGWATWRRSWQLYRENLDMTDWPELKHKGRMRDLMGDKFSAKTWSKILAAFHEETVNSWEGPLILSSMKNSGLWIHPTVNLISNIGFDMEATHTKKTNKLVSNIQSNFLHFPLRHPKFIIRNAIADRVENKQYKATFFHLLTKRIKKVVLHEE